MKKVCLLIIPLLATCTHDSLPGEESQDELRLSAQCAGALTRSTVQGTWAGGEEVKVTAGGTQKAYTLQSDGTLLPGSEGPLHWTRTDTMHVSAFYAPVQDLTTRFKIETGQNQTYSDGLTGVERSDVLYAPPAAFAYGSTAELRFRHLTAMVTLTIQADASLPDVNLSNAYVFFVNQSRESGTVDRATGAVEKLPLSADYRYKITPEAVGTATTDSKTVRALLVPQYGAEVGFVTVEFRKDDGKTVNSSYLYTPLATAPLNLEAGKSYSLLLTLTQSQLTLSKLNINGWSVTEETLDSWPE
jgi:hypothetical protein